MKWTLTTFNIQYCARKHWLRKREALAGLLGRLSSDMICLQEVSAEGMAWIRATLPGWAWVGAGRDDGIEAGEHTPIFLRRSRWKMMDGGVFWFSPTPSQPSLGWDAVHRRVCAWMRVRSHDDSHRELAVFNVHLDHRGRRAREQSVQLLRSRLESLPPHCPAVIAGDCNFRADTPPYRQLMSSAPRLIDCGRAAVATPSGSESRPTWDGFGMFRAGRARIDYVFVDPQFEVTSYVVGANRIGGRRLSDHHPVSVTCRWRSESR